MEIPAPEYEATPSHQSGMGGIPHEQGAAFRVWAPNADAVYVMGTFNDWSERSHPLAAEADGYWSVDVEDAGVGDEYRYLIINGEQELSRIDPYAREVTTSVGNGVICDPAFDWGDDAFQIATWSELVIYELHVGTFGVEHDPPGTFQDVIDKLPYLQELGVNAIEIMPPMEFPGDYSWGYNTSHPFAIESRYGGVRSFKELVKAAHAHGIAVILDVVYNHLGPGDLSLWQFDGWRENGMGGIYFYNDHRAATPWGDTRPDYGRAEVRQYLRDNAMMWLDEYHVDGLRWDATAFIRNIEGHDMSPVNDLPEGWQLMQWINEEMAAHHPNALSIAEDLRGNAYITKATDAGGAGFGAQWDGDFVHPLRALLIPPDDAFRDLAQLRAALEHRVGDDAFARVIYTESHDEVANGKARVAEEIQPGNVENWFSKKRTTLGGALVLTAPGIPMLFQGQEFLEDGWFDDTDALEWSRVAEFEGLMTLYRDLIRLRRNVDGATRGLCGQGLRVHHVNDEKKLLTFQRWDEHGPGDDVMVVVNVANQSHQAYTVGLPDAGTWRVRLNSDSTIYDAAFGNQGADDVAAQEGEYDGLPFHGDINIGPYSVLILSQDPE